ncbi:unnamed protein product [Sphagnum balticum]
MPSYVALDIEADRGKEANHTNRILYWIETGKHVFETDNVEIRAIESTIGTEEVQQCSAGNATTPPSAHTAKTSSDNARRGPSDESLDSDPVELLIGFKDDLLIPSTGQIHSTFLRAQKIWRTYVTCANSLPSGLVPAGAMDPDILLQEMPPLPQHLPRKRSVTGEAVWYVPSPELPKSQRGAEQKDGGDWNPEYVHGVKKTFPLSISKPTEYGISNRSDFRFDPTQPNGIAILVSLWSYIISMRFLEMQKRCMRYSDQRLMPTLAKDVRPQPSDIVIHLGPASRDMVRWFCAVLAPGLGWSVRGPLPPWAAHYHRDIRFVITVDLPFMFLDHERPPSSHKAADLLMEFCTFFNFGSRVAERKNSCQPFEQITVAFLAALTLPFYNSLGLRPLLPRPRVTADHISRLPPPECVRDYINDLPYYMTLSIHPGSVGSVIWSIFWEPGLDCNLVSAWFGAIREVLRPIIEAADLEMLVKVFITRRLRPALLWLGVLVMCDVAMLDMLLSYLESHQERENFGSWSGPDVDVAVWTGSKQSFLDEDISDTYKGIATQVPRSDLLRHRFNFRLGDLDALRFGWQPVGHVLKQQIEPELWQRLEAGCSRKYEHWIWWLPERDTKGTSNIPEVMIPDIQQGFRHNKIRCRPSVKAELNPEIGTVAIPDGFSCKVRLAPSKKATFHIISYGSKDVTGDCSLEAMVIPGVRCHPWMADSRGI